MPIKVSVDDAPTDQQVHIDTLPYGYYFLRLGGANCFVPVLVAYYNSGRCIAISLTDPKSTWTGIRGVFIPIKTKIEIIP